MNTNQVKLPPIQHVLKGLFNTNPDHQKNHVRRSSFGYDSTIEAARSLQKMSSADIPCYHYPPAAASPYEQQFNRGHRRTVSASIEVPFQQPVYQAIPFPTRRARAHTTSGYPPTMVAPRFSETRPTKETHRYHCHHCSKTFSRPSSLRIHIYSHTGEKPFKCNHQGCGRSFSVHSNMRRHLRVHYYQQPREQQARQVLTSMRLPIIPAPSVQQP